LADPQTEDPDRKKGFPDLRITAKVNTLVEHDHFSTLDRFAELDVQEYDAVIGNPPYIRAERSAQALDRRSQMEFERDRDGHPGISSKLNSYALFLYRALDRWCKPADESGNAGRVGFVLQVSLFDSNDNAALRSLFAPGGRWTIREIVDLEVIYRKVFDADVMPAILIAENRPAREDDVVSVRFADATCVTLNPGNALPEFDLEALPESIVPYADLFSPDGRILTKITPARSAILTKLQANSTFEDVAKEYWVKKQGSKIVEWVDVDPAATGWERRRMLAGGFAFRTTGEKPIANPGIAVYKGENIIAAELQGPAVLDNADMTRVDDSSLWKYASILPAQGLAVAQMAHCPNGVLFDPSKVAFTNTATILLPRDEFAHVPFDLLLMSNVYVWFYALGARMGVLRTLRSHIYPTNLAFLPWNDALAQKSTEIEAMRASITSACRSRIAAEESLRSALKEMSLKTFKNRLREDIEASVSWGDSFNDAEYKVVVDQASISEVDGEWRVSIAPGLFDWVECNRHEIAVGLILALAQKDGEELTKSALMNLKVPCSEEEVTDWQVCVANHHETSLAEAMTVAINGLDAVVGEALGLSLEDISALEDDLFSDSFLRGIRPRYPGTITRKMGFREGLDSATRYEA
jgi:hypothetical protein